MSKLKQSITQNWFLIVTGIITILLISGVIFVGQYLQQLKKEKKITLESLKNAEYQNPGGKKNKMNNGIYYPTPPPQGESIKDYYTEVEEENIAFGDLNNDGLEDSAVVLKSQYGGTGRFRNLAAVINQNGQPYNIATTFLGDRTKIHSLKIEEGIIILKIEEWIGGPQPPRVVRFKLSDKQLVQF